MQVTMILFLFAFATMFSTLAVLLLLSVILRQLLLVTLLLVREVRVTTLALDGRELIGMVLLAFASDGVSIILQQNRIAGIGKLKVIQVIVSCDNRDDKIPFLGQGSKEDHGLHLRWDDHTSSREVLEGCTHLIDLGTRMTIRVNANAKDFFEVLIDAGRSGSVIRVFEAKPNFRCLVKVNDILLDGLLNSEYYITKLCSPCPTLHCY